MRVGSLRWDEWNVEHIARHGVAPEEVEDVVYARDVTTRRVGEERYLLTGRTAGGATSASCWIAQGRDGTSS